MSADYEHSGWDQDMVSIRVLFVVIDSVGNCRWHVMNVGLIFGFKNWILY